MNQAPVINMMQTSAKDEDPVKEGIQVREGSVMNMSGMASDKDGDALTWEWIYKVEGGEEVVYESGVGRGGVVSVDTGGWSGKVEWIFRVRDGVNEVEKRLSMEVVKVEESKPTETETSTSTDTSTSTNTSTGTNTGTEKKPEAIAKIS